MYFLCCITLCMISVLRAPSSVRSSHRTLSHGLWLLEGMKILFEIFQKEVNLASMLPLTSYQSMGLELRELISEKSEKKANQLDKERIRSNVNLLEANSKIALNKRQIQDSFKLLDYTNLRLKSFADNNSSNNQS